MLLIPAYTQSAWFGSHTDESSQSSRDLIVQALELASIVEQKSNTLFGSLFESKDEKTTGKQHQKLLLSKKINLLKEKIYAVKHESLNPIKRFLNPAIQSLQKPDNSSNPTFETDKTKVLKLLQELYALCFSGLELNKGLFNTKKPFLRINYSLFKNLAKADMPIIEDIKNILALLWIQYIEIYGNDVVEFSFPRQGSMEQKLNFSALRWAYFTAHSGSDFTENQLLNDYSKPCILKIFTQITKEAQDLSKEINTAAQDINYDKENFLKILKPKISNLYQKLILKKQAKDKYFKLFPEFQDAFPVIDRAIPLQKPELPMELATTLTNIAEVWLKLINNMMVTKEETILLTYPEIIDPITTAAVEVAVATWMHTTGCAGYSNWSYNITYEKLIEEPTLFDNYKAWATSLPEKARGLLDRFLNRTDSSFDPSIFNN